MRTKGSCKFEPYYKVEWYHERLCCWVPIQRSLPTPEFAHQLVKKGARYRVMIVRESGIEIGPEAIRE